MDKFEQIPEISERIKRSNLQLENGRYVSLEWTSQACGDEDFVNNFRKGWQFQQAEVDQLQQYNDDLARGQCCLYKTLEEKDKWIEELESALKKINENLDLHDCESCLQHYFEIEKVLSEMQ